MVLNAKLNMKKLKFDLFLNCKKMLTYTVCTPLTLML